MAILLMSLHLNKEWYTKYELDVRVLICGILLLHELSGNSLGNIGNDLKDLNYPTCFNIDEADKRVDDCIALPWAVTNDTRRL